MCPRFLPWTQQQMLRAAKPVSSLRRNGQFQVWKTSPDLAPSGGGESGRDGGVVGPVLRLNPELCGGVTTTTP